MRTLEQLEQDILSIAKDLSYIRNQPKTPIQEAQDDLLIDVSIKAGAIEQDPRKEALMELGTVVMEAWCQTALKNSRQLNVFNKLNDAKVQNLLRVIQG